MNPTMIVHTRIGGKTFEIATNEFSTPQEMAEFFTQNYRQHTMYITDEDGVIL